MTVERRTDLLLLMIIMMSGRVAAHAFAADQFQEALPGRYSTPGNVVRALRVLFLLSSDPSLAIQHPPLFVLAEFLAAAAQSGNGTAAVPISSSAATRCDYACNKGKSLDSRLPS